MRNILWIVIICTVGTSNTIANKTLVDTCRLFYNIDVSDINQLRGSKLDSLISDAQSRNDLKLQIVGFTDYLGSDAYNMLLSSTRANKVKRFLIQKGIKSAQITLCEGRGELKPGTSIDKSIGIPVNRRVEIITESYMQERKEVLDIENLKIGDKIILKNMYFLPGRHILRDISKPELQILLNTLVQNPTLKIGIEGHICCERNVIDGLDHDTGESKLSVNRAKAIYNFLIENGIDKARLSYSGFGMTRPLVDPERTVDDENMNRRVELVIIE